MKTLTGVASISTRRLVDCTVWPNLAAHWRRRTVVRKPPLTAPSFRVSTTQHCSAPTTLTPCRWFCHGMVSVGKDELCRKVSRRKRTSAKAISKKSVRPKLRRVHAQDPRQFTKRSYPRITENGPAGPEMLHPDHRKRPSKWAPKITENDPPWHISSKGIFGGPEWPAP